MEVLTLEEYAKTTLSELHLELFYTLQKELPLLLEQAKFEDFLVSVSKEVSKQLVNIKQASIIWTLEERNSFIKGKVNYLSLAEKKLSLEVWEEIANYKESKYHPLVLKLMKILKNINFWYMLINFCFKLNISPSVIPYEKLNKVINLVYFSQMKQDKKNL